ncbi:unnamed protein product [Didymodactylos carnosus]|uniref:SHSP domain-containing protein n=1 Tax=Didymodactylos carnosus TaxID=1234261 RepID=A0A8S2EWC9_9BILA|nr:unnamed protein product [Didymodactylos carnosus]CAF4077402.1 unnamed protein product [Didymodactylos carnosus]
MSFIRPSFFRRHLWNDPFDNFLGSNFDWYDPFDEYDRSIFPIHTPQLNWIREPERRRASTYQRGQSTEKFRVQLNVAGFTPDTVKTNIEGNKLIITAKQEERDGDDFHVREFRKSYDIPEHADKSNLASYITPNNMLIVELPVNNPIHQQQMLDSHQKYRGSDQSEHERQIATTHSDSNQNGQQLAPKGYSPFDFGSFYGSTFGPKIVDGPSGEKKIDMNLDMKGYTPEQIKVSVKDNDVCVQAEQSYRDNNRSSRSYSYKQVTLPPGTQIENLQSTLTQDGHLKIEAPYRPLQGQQAIEKESRK